MNEELILVLGEKIRERRLSKKITLDDLAKKVGVTKGLLSQIENSRSLPSVPVLLSVIHALGENMRDFFGDLHEHVSNKESVIIVRGNEHNDFSKEPVKGLSYKRIFSKSLSTQAIDVAILELAPGCGRKKMITTEAFEYKYVLSGRIEYRIEEHSYILNGGDSLFFDGRRPHKLINVGKSVARIHIIYFF